MLRMYPSESTLVATRERLNVFAGHCVQEMSLHVLRVSSRIFYLHPENFENNENNENNENLLLGVAMIGIGSWLWR